MAAAGNREDPPTLTGIWEELPFAEYERFRFPQILLFSSPGFGSPGNNHQPLQGECSSHTHGGSCDAIFSSLILSNGTFQLSIGCLKSGFKGTIERNTNVADPGDWREAGAIPASDYLSAWSELLGASTFFRFQQK